jgi:diguanylate cyclase (GGDEF)-like protein
MRDTTTWDIVDREIDRLSRKTFRDLAFSRPLEDQFEHATRCERSHRLWLEGLIAIIVLNCCLLADYLLVRDVLLASIVLQTTLVTPLALAVNWLMRRNPPYRIREGSVAIGTALICFLNLHAEGSRTAATAGFGLMSVLITVAFVNVVMRLRFPYAAVSTAMMLAGGVWFALNAHSLSGSEKVIGASMLALGVMITLTAGHSLERQERLGYLLLLRSELQGVELNRLSNLDPLTALPNRRAFEDRFDVLWTEAAKTRTLLSAIVIDLDHFKLLNDVYGHLYGDEVLRRTAALLPQALRTQDDLVARFGGEEFVVLLPGLGAEHALLVAERVRSLVEMVGTPIPEQVAGRQTMWSTVSCGVSTCVPDSRNSRERLLWSADRALYLAKANGRNRVEFQDCDPGSDPHPHIAADRLPTVRMLDPVED